MQKIFLVEDSPLVLMRLIDLLGALPNARIVGHAASADEAIRGILSSRPDVVVTDLKLAQGTGFDVLIAVHSQAPGTTFYMLSNFAQEAYRRQAERLGACGFFDKSTDFERVRDVLAQRAASQTH